MTLFQKYCLLSFPARFGSFCPRCNARKRCHFQPQGRIFFREKLYPKHTLQLVRRVLPNRFQIDDNADNNPSKCTETREF